MHTELIVTFDGDSEALREHRLSVSDFSEPLQLLLQALRRTASAMGSTIEAGESYGERGGRFTRMASALDLQLTALADGSVRLAMDCIQDVPQGHMWFTRDALTRVLDDLEQEAQGNLRNGNARKYLAALPPYVRSQRYAVRAGGDIVHEVSIGDVHIAEMPSDLPRVFVMSGLVAGVVMETGRESVLLRHALPPRDGLRHC